MIDDDLSREKKEFILPALILCLVDHWTYTDNLQRDLIDLQISNQKARATLKDLIKRNLVLETVIIKNEEISTLTIFDQPKKFHEAIILTENGYQLCQGYDLNSLIDHWKKIVANEGGAENEEKKILR